MCLYMKSSAEPAPANSVWNSFHPFMVLIKEAWPVAPIFAHPFLMAISWLLGKELFLTSKR